MSQKAKGVKHRSDIVTTARSIDSDNPQSIAPDALQPVDENFLQQLRPGAHLFSADYTMYSVVDVPTENDIILTQSFDEKEEKKSYTWDDLLAGQWWYNPEAPHKK